MFNPNEALMPLFCRRLREGYRQMFGRLKGDYADIICWVGRMALEYINTSDALYHNAEHTMLVTLVGQEILRGKHMREGGVSPEDWLHFLISLACHDIGYVKGVCRQDRREESLFAAGRNGAMIALPPGSSDASLTPYHVDRAKLFIEERFDGHALIQVEVIKKNIELTRFPVPAADDHKDNVGFPALVRAADLIGQLSDPRYLKKCCALFYEFEETGTNKILGYKDPGDLRRNYPKFYWQAVAPYIRSALGYLALTQQGQQTIANLNTHVFVIEHERPSEDWIRKLNDRDRYVRMQAAAALSQIGADALKAVPGLIKALADEDESIRQWAGHALGKIGPEAVAAVPALTAALGDENAFVRLKAAEALWSLGHREESLLATLAEALGHDNWLVVRESAFILGKIGPSARPAIPPLVAAVKHPSSETRKAAAEALKNIDAEALILALMSALRCPDKYVRMEAAFGLGEMGRAARSALPALLEALQDKSWLVCRAATVALGQIGPEARVGVAALIAALKDEQALVRQAAAETLGRIGMESGEAMPELIEALFEALRDKDDDVSREAGEALKKVRPRKAVV